MKKIIKDALVLCLITLIAGVLLGFVYDITKEPIARQNEKIKINAYNSVFDTLDSYEDVDIDGLQEKVNEAGYSKVTIDEVVNAYDGSNTLLGMIITVTDSEGYGGDIKMTVGIDVDGTITGLEMLSITETAGLGMKAQDSSFRSQFVGINAYEVVYTKSGKAADNEIDAISSATITTKAVTNGVNGALVVYRELGGAKSE